MNKKGTAIFLICLFLCVSSCWTVLAAQVPETEPYFDQYPNGSVITEPVIGVIAFGTGLLVLIALISLVVLRLRKRSVKPSAKQSVKQGNKERKRKEAV